MVGRNRRGNATKIMAMADGNGLPLSVVLAPGQRHEDNFVDDVIAARFTRQKPKRLICDKAYDSKPLDEKLKLRAIELIAPKSFRKGQTKPKTGRRQDRRQLRRYRRRWKVERLFSWLFNFRRLVTRYEYKAENFLGLVHMACVVILLRRSV